jgi:uncharacterized protein
MAPFRTAPRLVEILRCPRDGAELTRRELGAVVLHQCERCRGVWMDLEALDRLRQDRAARERVADDPCAHAPGVPWEPDASRPVRCCECGKPCERREYGPETFIEVDLCPQHGVWMAAGELFAALYIHGLG